MVEKISQLLAEKIVLNIGQEEDQEIYEYGLQIFLNTLFSISIVLVLSILIKEFCGTVIFLISYCSIRLYAGGLHADTNNKCMMIFVGGYVIASIITQNIEITLNAGIIIILLLFNVCIGFWAPVDALNNPVPIQKRSIMRKRASLISIIITGVTIIMLYNEYKGGKWALAGVCWFFCILVLGKSKNFLIFRRYRDEKNQKKVL